MVSIMTAFIHANKMAHLRDPYEATKVKYHLKFGQPI